MATEQEKQQTTQSENRLDDGVVHDTEKQHAVSSADEQEYVGIRIVPDKHPLILMEPGRYLEDMDRGMDPCLVVRDILLDCTVSCRSTSSDLHAARQCRSAGILHLDIHHVCDDSFHGLWCQLRLVWSTVVHHYGSMLFLGTQLRTTALTICRTS